MFMATRLPVDSNLSFFCFFVFFNVFNFII
jgi:hypothetical protein